MDSQTCRALQIVLNVHELKELQKYRRIYGEDTTWQRNFDFVFTEINKHFATINESFATFKCGDFELCAYGGYDWGIVCTQKSAECCFVESMFIIPAGDDISLEQTIVNWKLSATSREQIASYIHCRFPEIIPYITIRNICFVDDLDTLDF